MFIADGCECNVQTWAGLIYWEKVFLPLRSCDPHVIGCRIWQCWLSYSNEQEVDSWSGCSSPWAEGTDNGWRKWSGCSSPSAEGTDHQTCKLASQVTLWGMVACCGTTNPLCVPVLSLLGNTITSTFTVRTSVLCQ